MYYPYFRGKQYELITIRESASLIASSNFTPIIEPVREQTTGLSKTLDVLSNEGAAAIIIINPQIGDHSDDSTGLVSLIEDRYASQDNLIFGLLLTETMGWEEIVNRCEQYQDQQVALIHAGFSDARQLGIHINQLDNILINIFMEEYCGKLYQRHFRNEGTKVLVRDGFQNRRNRDHPDTAEFFSDLHATFDLENMDGFGDFLVVGNEYSESGGPAYTIAIHLTYIDEDKDDEMHIRHFKSDRQDTPKDPAGKFSEALGKLINTINQTTSKFHRSSAIIEFQELYNRGHYPGLGHVKKLSMKHHIETLAAYFERHGTTG